MYLILVFVNQMSLGLFRLIASVGRVMLVAATYGSLVLLLTVVLGGFVVARREHHSLSEGYLVLLLLDLRFDDIEETGTAVI